MRTRSRLHSPPPARGAATHYVCCAALTEEVFAAASALLTAEFPLATMREVPSGWEWELARNTDVEVGLAPVRGGLA